ncbi:hypothetical protein [Salinibacter sp. 10B]|uniref:hypothetical protein n=1 Tax=Salinibacter sp. 10B TaxID=1923971 RepID=UPI0021583A06|nr:hypothetical protein [Salinibacter sp. 10B]
MKLVAVMSLDAYRDDLHRIYREHAIRVFSELDIEGYHHSQTPSAAAIGWFGRSESPAYSTLTWAFLAEEQAADLLDAIEHYNDTHNLDHPVRAFQMPVDKAV